VAPKKPDALLRAEQFLRAAEEEVTVLAGRSFDVRLVKILQLIVLPNLLAARAAIRVARHIDQFPNRADVLKGEEGSGGKDDDKKL